MQIFFEVWTGTVWNPAGSTTESNSNYISSRLSQLCKTHGASKARAKDAQGRIIDLVG